MVEPQIVVLVVAGSSPSRHDLAGEMITCVSRKVGDGSDLLDQVLFCSLHGRSSVEVFLSGDLKPDSRERLCAWQLFSKIKSQ